MSVNHCHVRDWPVPSRQVGDAADIVEPMRQPNEPMLAAVLASCTLDEVMGRFGLSPRKLARMRERHDL